VRLATEASLTLICFNPYPPRFFRYVRRIAEIVGEEMGLEGLGFRFTGGVDGGRGWKENVKTMRLSVERLGSLGWKPVLISEEAIRRGCGEILCALKG